jgi:hypothetical protein
MLSARGGARRLDRLRIATGIVATDGVRKGDIGCFFDEMQNLVATWRSSCGASSRTIGEFPHPAPRKVPRQRRGAHSNKRNKRRPEHFHVRVYSVQTC